MSLHTNTMQAIKSFIPGTPTLFASPGETMATNSFIKSNVAKVTGYEPCDRSRAIITFP